MWHYIFLWSSMFPDSLNYTSRAGCPIPECEHCNLEGLVFFLLQQHQWQEDLNCQSSKTSNGAGQSMQNIALFVGDYIMITCEKIPGSSWVYIVLARQSLETRLSENITQTACLAPCWLCAFIMNHESSLFPSDFIILEYYSEQPNFLLYSSVP